MSNLLNIKDQSGNWIPIPVVTNGIKSITQNQDYTLTITLNDGTAYTTTSIKGEDGQDYVLTEQDKQEIAGLVDTPVDDVRINGTSIVENGVATIPIANADNAGVVKVDTYENGYSGGIATIHDKLYLIGGSSKNVKNGYDYATPIAAGNQHEATFYGLAKAAGHDEKDSTLSVGTYTDEAKASIKNMLGVEDVDIDSKAPVITETVSGDIVSFDDGADDMPLQSLVVDINPVQDLHGYDSPWPAGGGKNKLNIDESVMVAAGYNRFFPISLTAGDYVISRSGIFGSGYGARVSLTDKTIGETILQTIAPSYAFGRTESQESYSFTITEEVAANTKYLDLQVNGNGITFADVESCKLMVESGTTKTDYAPYENICPISGWTGCEVQRTGKNLLALPVIRFSEGTATVDNCFYVRQGTYTLSYSCADTHRFGVRMMDANGVIYTTSADTPMSGLSYNASAKCHYVGADIPSGSKTFTLTIKHDCYIRIVSNLTGGGFTDVQLELGSTATPYEPYTGRSITIDLGQTIYGGKLDVLSGELVITWVNDATPSRNPAIIRTYADYKDVGWDVPSKLVGLLNVKSQAFATKSVNGIPPIGCVAGRGANTYVTFGVPNDHATDAQTAGDYIRSVSPYICYELATPLAIQLTPNQVNSLLGVNNIWADSGDTEVEYRADTKLYIQKKITEAVSALT